MPVSDQQFARLQDGLCGLYPKASIIILTYNNLDYNRQCLESIFASTAYPNFDVIVVDNASSDGTPAFLRSFAASHPNLRVILNPENAGFAAGNNQGFAASDGEYVVFLNNDTVVTPGWLSGLIRYLRDPAVGFVGPVTNFSGNESRISVDYADIRDLNDFARRYTNSHRGQSFDIRMLALFCAVTRRSVLEEIGPLDERFNVGMYEDDDYSLRLRHAGYQILCAEDVYVHHWGSAGFSQFAQERYNRLQSENRRKFEEKWGTRWIPHRWRMEEP
jgi:GT2 family glycosyltransferase